MGQMLRDYPELWYRAKAVYNAVVLLVTGVGVAVTPEEWQNLVLLFGGVLAALGVHQVKNGPEPGSTDPASLDHRHPSGRNGLAGPQANRPAW